MALDCINRPTNTIIGQISHSTKTTSSPQTTCSSLTSPWHSLPLLLWALRQRPLLTSSTHRRRLPHTKQSLSLFPTAKPCQSRKDAAGFSARALDAVRSCAVRTGKSSLFLTMRRRSQILLLVTACIGLRLASIFHDMSLDARMGQPFRRREF